MPQPLRHGKMETHHKTKCHYNYMSIVCSMAHISVRLPWSLCIEKCAVHITISVNVLFFPFFVFFYSFLVMETWEIRHTTPTDWQNIQRKYTHQLPPKSSTSIYSRIMWEMLEFWLVNFSVWHLNSDKRTKKKKHMRTQNSSNFWLLCFF